MAETMWTPAMRWFLELLAVRLENKLLRRELDDVKAKLAQVEAAREV